jgi:hypothetical protein
MLGAHLASKLQTGVRCSLEQMLEVGFYHADPQWVRQAMWRRVCEFHEGSNERESVANRHFAAAHSSLLSILHVLTSFEPSSLCMAFSDSRVLKGTMSSPRVSWQHCFQNQHA